MLSYLLFYNFLQKNMVNMGVFFTLKLTIFYIIFILFLSNLWIFIDFIAPKLLQNRFSKSLQPCGCKIRRFYIMPFWMTWHYFHSPSKFMKSKFCTIIFLLFTIHYLPKYSITFLIICVVFLLIKLKFLLTLSFHILIWLLYKLML